jgi:hypothetical protein
MDRVVSSARPPRASFALASAVVIAFVGVAASCGGSSSDGAGGSGGSGGDGSHGGSCSASCYTGPAGTENVGVCKAGCTEDGVCRQQVLPSAEDCQTSDDENCDGKTACTGDTAWMIATSNAGSTDVAAYANTRVGRSGDVLVFGQGAESFNLGGHAFTASLGQFGYLAKVRASDGATLMTRTFESSGGNATAILTGAEELPNGDVIVVGYFIGSPTFAKLQRTTSFDGGFVSRVDGKSGAIVWAQSIAAPGETGFTAAFGLALGPSNEVYVCGDNASSIRGENGTVIRANGENDAYVVRFDTDGNLERAVDWGVRSSSAACHGITVAASGEVIVQGQYAGEMTFGSQHLTGGMAPVEFVAQLTPELAPTWAQPIVGMDLSETLIEGVAVDPKSGRIIAAGAFNKSIAIGKLEVDANAIGDDFNAFVAIWEKDGTPAVLKSFGHGANQSAMALAVDGAGQIVIGGDFSGTIDDGACHLTAADSNDAFVMKLASDATPIWCRTNKGSGSGEWTSGLTVDAGGNIFASGGFHQKFTFDSGHVASCPGCDQGLWISRLDP